LEEKVLKEKKGFKVEIRNVFREPALLITLIILALLFAVFIIYPFIKILLIPKGSDWLRFFREKQFTQAFKNTIFSSILSTSSAIVLGFVYAYTLNYTDIPGKKFFRVVGLLPIMAPSVVTGLAFIMLFGRRGIITYQLLGLTTDLYGWVGLWIVQTIAFFPLAYMTISGVLKSISPNLELAAQNMGARGFTLFRTVTVKLATPGILSAFLLVAINSFADFGNPMLVGGNYRVLATEAYAQVTGTFDMGIAAVLSAMLVIPTLLVFLLQKYYIDKKSYVTVTGKPTSGLNRDAVSKSVKVILFSICSFIALIIVLIFGIIICFAFTKVFGINNQITFNNFVEGVIKSNVIKNSWLIAMATAVITTMLGLVLAFVVSRKSFPGKNILDFLALLPISMPGTFIGLALIMTFNKGLLPLTGTVSIIIIGMCLRQMPVGYRNAMAGFKQVDKSIEDASTNLGANSVITFRKIVLPMLKSAFSTSLVYSFMKSMNTLSTVIFLVSPQWMLASVAIMNNANRGFYGLASAMAIGMMAVIMLTFGIVKLIFGNKINVFDL
jgi:iron(III) transport system permease protein